jgi:hypothetical protein
MVFLACMIMKAQCCRSVLLLVLAVLALLVNTGCSGIQASKSFSPLDFFLPGLLQNTPNQATPPSQAPEQVAIALAN